jgi:hypothetical protein
MTAQLPPPRLVTGYGWQRPPDGRLAHVVPAGESYTLCGLVTSVAEQPWSIVLHADLDNGMGWCQTCGERTVQRSLAASAANGRILIAGRRSPAEVRRVLGSLDARMGGMTKDILAKLDHRMSTTDRRGAARRPPPVGVAPHSIAVSNGSGHRATFAAPRPRPSNESTSHRGCVVCKERPPDALTAGGRVQSHPPWFTSVADYRAWVTAGRPKRWTSR